MKALTIRQPWVHAILHFGKRVENRDWRAPPRYRGPILIHAAAGCGLREYAEARFSIQGQGLGDPPPLRSLVTKGAIVGRARLADVVRNGLTGHRWPFGQDIGATCMLCGATNAPPNEECEERDPWAVPGAVGLLLADVEVLTTPIPLKGALGLFNVPDKALNGAEWWPAPALEVPCSS